MTREDQRGVAADRTRGTGPCATIRSENLGESWKISGNLRLLLNDQWLPYEQGGVQHFTSASLPTAGAILRSGDLSSTALGAVAMEVEEEAVPLPVPDLELQDNAMRSVPSAWLPMALGGNQPVWLDPDSEGEHDCPEPVIPNVVELTGHGMGQTRQRGTRTRAIRVSDDEDDISDTEGAQAKDQPDKGKTLLNRVASGVSSVTEKITKKVGSAKEGKV